MYNRKRMKLRTCVEAWISKASSQQSVKLKRLWTWFIHSSTLTVLRDAVPWMTFRHFRRFIHRDSGTLFFPRPCLSTYYLHKSYKSVIWHNFSYTNHINQPLDTSFLYIFQSALHLFTIAFVGETGEKEMPIFGRNQPPSEQSMNRQ